MDSVIFNKVSESYKIKFTYDGKDTVEDFVALSDVSFAVKRGESFCIIGENGAGKTTTLKLIYQMLSPDSGKVIVEGKVSALLDLGAGFNPELTGSENIKVTAALYGLSDKEINEIISQIEEFSGLGRFIHAPVKTYSQGMFVRLGFSLAIHIQADIILIDDIFAVGDESFQKKCLDKLFEFKQEGKTIIFASHDIAKIREFCDRGILLRDGKVVSEGTAEKIISYYLSTLGNKEGIKVISKEDIGVIFNNGKILITYKGLPVTKHMGLYYSFNQGALWRFSGECKWNIKESNDDSLVLEGSFTDCKGILIFTIKIIDNSICVNLKTLKMPIDSTSLQYINLLIDEDYLSWKYWRGVYSFPDKFVYEKEWEHVSAGEYIGDAVATLPADSSTLPYVLFSPDTKDKGEFLVQNSGSDLRCRVVQYNLSKFEKNSKSADIDFSFKLDLFDGEADRNFYDFFDKKLENNFITSSDFKLFYTLNGAKLFFKDIEITKDSGFNTVLICDNKEYHSAESIWSVAKGTDNKLVLTCDQADIPFEQKWIFEFEQDGKLAWNIEINNAGKKQVTCLKKALILSDYYTEVVADDLKATFPEYYTWGQVLTHEHVSFCGVAPVSIINTENTLSGLIIEDVDLKNKLVVQNSDEKIRGRVLQVFPSNDKDSLVALKISFLDNPEYQEVIESKISKLKSKREIHQNGVKLSMVDDSVDVFCDGEKLTHHGGVSVAFMIDGKWTDTRGRKWNFLRIENNLLRVKQKIAEVDVEVEFSFREDNALLMDVSIYALKDINFEELRAGLIVGSSYNSYFDGENLKTFSNRFFWNDIDCGDNRIFVVSDKLKAVEIEGNGSGLIQNTGEEVGGRILAKKYKETDILSKGKSYRYSNAFILRDKDDAFQQIQDLKEVMDSQKQISHEDINLKVDGGTIAVCFAGQLVGIKKGLYVAVYSKNIWHDSQSGKWEIKSKTDKSFCVSQRFLNTDIVIDINVFIKDSNTIALTIADATGSDIGEIRFGLMLPEEYKNYYIGNNKNSFRHGFSWEDIDCGYNNVIALSDVFPAVEISGSGRALIQNTDQRIKARIFTKRIADVAMLKDAFIELKFMPLADLSIYFQKLKDLNVTAIADDFLKFTLDGGDIKVFGDTKELTAAGGLNLSFMIDGQWFESYTEVWDVVKNKNNNIILRQSRKKLGLVITLNIFLKDRGSAAISVEMEALKDVTIEKFKVALILNDNYIAYYKDGQEISFGDSSSWEDILCGTKKMALLSDCLPLIEFDGFGNALIQKTGQGQVGKILIRESSKAIVLKKSDHREFLAFVNLTPFADIGRKLTLWQQEAFSKRELENNEFRITETEGSIKIYYKEKEITKHGGVHTAIKINGRWFDTQRRSWHLEEKSKNKMLLRQYFEELKLTNFLTIVFDEEHSISFENKIVSEQKHKIEEIRCGIVVESGFKKYLFKNELVKFNEIFRWHDILCGHDRLICYKPDYPCVEVVGEGEGLIQNTDKDISGRIILKKSKESFVISPGSDYKYNIAVNFLSSDSVLDYVDSAKELKQKKHFIEKGSLSIRESLGSIKIYFQEQELTKQGGLNAAVLVNDKWFDTQKSEWSVEENTGFALVLKQSWEEIGLVNQISIEIKGDNTVKISNSFIALKDIAIQEIRIAVVLSENYLKYVKENKLCEFSSVFRWEDIVCDGSKMTAVSRVLPCVEFSGEGKNLLQNTGEQIKGRILLKCFDQNLSLKNNESYSISNTMKLFLYDKLIKEIENKSVLEKKRYFIERGDFKVYAVEGSIKIYCRGEEITKHGGLNTAVSINSQWFDTKKSVWDVVSNDGKTMILSQKWQQVNLENRIHIMFNTDSSIKLKNEFIGDAKIIIDEIRSALVVSSQYDSFFVNNNLKEFPSVFRWEDINCKGSVVCVSKELPVVSLSGDGESLLQNTDDALRARILLKQFNKNIILSNKESYKYESLVCFTSYSEFIRQIESEKKISESKRIIEKSNIVVRESHGSIKFYHKGTEITKESGLNTAVLVDGRWFNTQSSTWDTLPSGKDEMILTQFWKEIGVTNRLILKLNDNNVISFKNELSSVKDIEIQEIRTAVVCSGKYNKYLSNLKIKDFSSVYRWEDINCDTGRMALISSEFPAMELSGSGLGLIQNTDQTVKGRIMLIRRQNSVLLSADKGIEYDGKISLIQENDIIKYLEDIYALKNKERVLSVGDVLVRESHGSIRIYNKEKEITKQAGLHIALKVRGRWFDTKGLSWTVVKNKNSEIVLRQKWNELSLTNTLTISINNKNKISFKNEISGNKKSKIDEIRIALVLGSEYDRYLRGNKLLNFNSVYKWEDILCEQKRMMCLSEKNGGVELLGDGEGLIQNTGEEIKGRILLKKITEDISVSFIKKYVFKGSISFSSYADVIKMIEDDFLRRSLAKTIKKGDLVLRETKGNIKIYLKERELTSNSGLNNVLVVAGKIYESHNADVELQKISPSSVVIRHAWHDIGCTLIWSLNITQKDLIDVKLDIEVKDKLTIDEFKVALLLNDIYKGWMLGLRRDLFPVVSKWQDIAEGDDEMAVLDADVPAVVFSGNGYSIIQNTGEEINGRLLVKDCLDKKSFSSGTYNVFSGFIKLETDSFLNDAFEQKRKKDQLNKIIIKEALSIKASSQSIDIYKEQQMLTRAAGLSISFIYKGRGYNAVESKVSIRKLDDSSMSVVYFWDEIKLKIETNINISDNGLIKWKINWVNLLSDEMFDELRAGIFVDGLTYNKWICEDEFGSFPESLSWSDIRPKAEKIAKAVVYNESNKETLVLNDKDNISSLLLQNTDKKPKTHYLGRVFTGSKKSIDIEIDTNASFSSVQSLINNIEQKHSENNYISSVNYSISVCGNFLKLFYKDNCFSESIGLHTAVLSGGKWYSSQNADWKAERLSPTKMKIICSWHHISLQQEWIIDFIDNNILEWKVFHKPLENCCIDEIKVGFIINNNYKQWFNAFESGHFKDDGKWANMEIQHLTSHVNGVFGDDVFPGIAFFDETMEWETLVQNGGEGVMGRLLVWQKKLSADRKNGEVDFKGILKFYPDSGEIENLIQNQRALFWQQQNKGRYISVKDIMLLLDKGGKIQIYYQGKLVTADIGLNTKFISGNKEFKSDETDFKILQAEGNILSFCQEWEKDSIIQFFSLKIEGQSIFIDSKLELKKKMPLRQQRIALRLNSDFSFFNEDKKEDIRHRKHINDLSCRIFYVGSTENKKLDILWVPEVFDCVRMYSFFYDESRDENELLLYLEPEFKDNIYPKGKHSYYKGCINLCSKQKEKQNLFSKQQDYRSKFLNTEAKLVSDNLSLVFDKNSFDLYKGANPLTKGLGVYSSYYSENVWHDSKSALWSVESTGKNKLVLIGVWTQLPMRQRWTFTLKNQSVFWEIEREIYDDFKCSIEQVNIMLKEQYTSYKAGKMATGYFPEGFASNNGMLWDCMWSGRASNAFLQLNSKKNPDVKFDFRKQGDEFRAVIENTDDNYQARVMQCQRINSSDGTLATHSLNKIFEGVIELADE